MYNLTDLHLHSEYSWDAQQKIKDITDKAGEKNILFAGIADHIDFFDWHPKGADKFDYESLTDEIEKFGESFPGLLKGAEVGEPHLFPAEFEKFFRDKKYDYIIGAVHHVDGETPVYDRYFHSARPVEEGYRAYFNEVRKLAEYGGVDVIAHLDLVHRRGANFYKEYSYEKFRDVIEPILEIMVDKKIGLEINASGLRHDAKNILPGPDTVKAYIEMGGDIITVGSDAHKHEDTFFGIEKAYEILDSLGVEEAAVFKDRKAEKIKLRK